ncbi:MULTISPECIES: tyrosine-type recombinase/integrase [unclassified Cryobacterium]|uniref:tyrosine-type recombinase/integrase n=1 Tax=unclassified Cryobacterium TaxID=2649013 RepID=UPI002AB4DB8E|nr:MULTISPECIES: tyrosine-type recombinase/integrase [unclassified Cryobacterium]MDY7543360.1 tyrosine-type recombinase/integrase [Cryobacterium sp. 5B3]MEB0000413.1 tyrosine-type recombinase/integrase [Cryobacterium sp. RTS3]MEB0276111.1 tyrosine-type recombinase/integrase [Cryobacterium sp. 5B3]
MTYSPRALLLSLSPVKPSPDLVTRQLIRFVRARRCPRETITPETIEPPSNGALAQCTTSGAISLRCKFSWLASIRTPYRYRCGATWSQGATRYLGTPKSGKARTVSLPGFLVAELRPPVDGQPPDAFVFRAARGGDIHESNWRGRVWAKAVTLAGLASKKPTPHDLRHAAASMTIASGADVKVVQLQLGHARATETLDVYAHLWPDRLDVVSDAVELARAAALRASEPPTDQGQARAKT